MEKIERELNGKRYIAMLEPNGSGSIAVSLFLRVDRPAGLQYLAAFEADCSNMKAARDHVSDCLTRIRIAEAMPAIASSVLAASEEHAPNL
jgi:hypothetical protein